MIISQIKNKLESIVTKYDIRQAKKTSYNPNALAIYFARIEKIISDIELGMNIDEAINRGFSDRLLQYVQFNFHKK